MGGDRKVAQVDEFSKPRVAKEKGRERADGKERAAFRWSRSRGRRTAQGRRNDATLAGDERVRPKMNLLLRVEGKTT